MTLNVRCLLCYEILECNHHQENTNLIEHIKDKHPDVKLTRIPEKQINLIIFDNIINTNDNNNNNNNKNNNHELKNQSTPLFMGTENDIIKLKNKNVDTNVEKTNDKIQSKNIEKTIKLQQFAKIACHNNCGCNVTTKEIITPTNSNSSINIKPSISSMLANLSESLSHSTINKIENDAIEISNCKCLAAQSKKSNKQKKANVWSTLFNTNNNEQPKLTNKLTAKNQNVLSSIYKRKFKPKKPIIPKLTKQRHKLYKTSVEKWRPGTSEITCPNCGVTKCPKIRQHSSRVSHSIIGATLILSCWPFCFLPCLFPPPTEEVLHCSLCNYYLGTYNSLNGLIIPNIICTKSNTNNNNVKIENN